MLFQIGTDHAICLYVVDWWYYFTNDCRVFPPRAHLTHWGRVTHICVSKLSIIDSDNGLSPERRQAIIWTNAGILLIGPLGTNFSEILIEILTFSFKKMRLKVSSAKWCPFCLGLNVLTHRGQVDLRKLAIFNTIQMSLKSWLSQEYLDAGCEHSLVPMDS